jgi:hypothetical protein
MAHGTEQMAEERSVLEPIELTVSASLWNALAQATAKHMHGQPKSSPASPFG